MKTDAASVIGKLLLAERNKQGMTQGQISAISKVSTRTIVSLERGKYESSKLRHDVIMRFSLALGKDPREWLEAVGLETNDVEVNRCRRDLGMTVLIDTTQLSKSQIVSSWMDLPHEE